MLPNPLHHVTYASAMFIELRRRYIYKKNTFVKVRARRARAGGEDGTGILILGLMHFFRPLVSNICYKRLNW